MSQHFLLSAQARSLSIRQIFALTDQAAFELFKQSRWGGGDPGCPRCGVSDKHYFGKSRRQWRCTACGHTFSVTSGTIFANHKLPLRIYLAAIAIYCNAVKGLSALQLSRDLDVQYKTAFVLSHKLRESLLAQRDDAPLDGEVEVDGAYVNGHVRPENKKADRIDRRLAENQNPDKRCVLVFRSRGVKGNGGKRSLTFVAKSENQAGTIKLAAEYVAAGTSMFADESSAYDPLHGMFPTQRVNHQIEYRAENGANTNAAESFFSRFRRMQYGQMHKFGTLYLDNYANEAAYREDNRRMSNGEMFGDIMTKCAATRASRDFCGYWQGNKRDGERLVS
jgi:transposase-like protein